MSNKFCGIELADDLLLNTAELHESASAAFAILKPKPSPVPLVRIGLNADGGYLVPDDMNGLIACFSPGVSNRKNFEDELTTRFGIKCHLCDYSSTEHLFSTPLIEGWQSFRKLWLDLPDVADSITLDAWVAELAPGPGDLLLQMDIEGAEYRNILNCQPETLRRFRIMLFELHGMHALLDGAALRQVLLPFLRKLDEDFVCVHVHPNNCCGEFEISHLGVTMPNVLELTFLRRDRFPADSPNHLVMLPHPLDITSNMPSVPPMFLSEAWFDGPRPLESRLKMLEDELAFERKRTEQAEVTGRRVLAEALALTMRAARTAATLPETSPVPDELDEVAIGRPYRLRSALPGYPAEGIVPNAVPAFFFHTNLGISEHITVELSELRRVREITIVNRRDSCFNRAQLLFVILHEHAESNDGATFLLQTLADFESGRVLEATLTVPSIPARYVTVLSAAHTMLHFSALRVMAEPVALASG